MARSAAASAEAAAAVKGQAYYHHVDALLFRGSRPVEKEELLAAIRNAALSLGIEPDRIEVIAGGYLVGPEPETGTRAKIKYQPDPS
jgi:hypothetical protein